MSTLRRCEPLILQRKENIREHVGLTTNFRAGTCTYTRICARRSMAISRLRRIWSKITYEISRKAAYKDRAR
eukprot:4491296-Pyramimonas_sp.AAC.1